MPRRILLMLFLLGTALFLQAAPADGQPPAGSDAVDKAIKRGVQFLLANQLPNGAWGSWRNTKGLNIYAPVPGAHHGFQAGTTALCVAALIDTGQSTKAVEKALDRAEAWMFRHLPKLRRATPDTIYNIWGHAYGLKALVRMLKRHRDDPGRCRTIKKHVAQQLDLIKRYETVNGGWNYYDFGAHTQKPDGSTPSFVTGTVLVALHEVKAAGIPVEERLIRRAMALLRRQRKPDFSYVYSESHKYHPMSPVNRPGGSLGRAQTCNLAMHLWGDKTVTRKVFKTWLERLFLRNGWLDMGRKRPVPHESWFQVAGYFYYYGHYYGGLCIQQLPAESRGPYQAAMARLLLPLQEKDGSWWDYPFYDYHRPYGTAYALLTLNCCRS